MVREDTSTKNDTIYLDLVVSQFCHAYPGEFRNGDIPFFQFWMLWSNFYRILALDKIIAAESYLIGKNISGGSDKSSQQLRRMSDYAFGHRETL